MAIANHVIENNNVVTKVNEIFDEVMSQGGPSIFGDIPHNLPLDDLKALMTDFKVFKSYRTQSATSDLTVEQGFHIGLHII